MADEIDDTDEDEGRPLDPEVAARRRLALGQVRQWGDPVLTTKARPVEHFDDALRAELSRMGGLMIDALGVGLAANQVGLLRRMLVYRVGDGPVIPIVNPVVEWSGEEVEPFEEGCLSLTGVIVEVERPVHVRVRAQDEFGEALTIEASGLEARVLQHEIDHLDGVLILDRVKRSAKRDAIRTLRDVERERELAS